MNKAKQKGDREERAVIDVHRGLGLDVKRTLESGARSDGSATWDIDLIVRGKSLKGECKMRKSGFKTIYDWIKGRDFLTVRVNNQERLYIMTEQTWKDLIK